MKISIPTVAIALALSALSAGAHDGKSMDRTVKNRMAIYFGDLDISTEQDAKTMLQRIVRGATKACGGQRTFNSYTGALDSSFDDCRAAAVRKAVEQLDAPLVTHLYSVACPSRFRRCAGGWLTQDSTVAWRRNEQTPTL